MGIEKHTPAGRATRWSLRGEDRCQRNSDEKRNHVAHEVLERAADVRNRLYGAARTAFA